ncbi:polymer-forming cytoskeletal protein [Paenibacillus sp. GYB003]|uniref:polymer-forming cytoskeletal protein n=1 Tax=Paenibacillus sp. GYB003 TaxID=2994392 RepID=UPI002F962CAD
METRQHLTIVGSGGSGGGSYNNVKVNGEAQFNGDIDCLAFRCNGTARVYGSLKGTSCNVNGTLDIAGDFDTGEAKINGKMEIDGNVKARTIKSFGETSVRGNVAGEEVGLQGYFSINGNCEAEQLRIKGIFRIGGLVNAGEVDLAVHSRCEVKEIGGESIRVHRSEGNVLKKLIGSFFLPADYYEGTLNADTIEGDHIYVEHTSAKAIRGTVVVVGPGCRIGRVEYTERFECHADSSVQEQEQL